MIRLLLLVGLVVGLQNPSPQPAVIQDVEQTVVDCDGSTYAARSEQGGLVDQSIRGTDPNGMGTLILDMADTKMHRLLTSKTGSSNCNPNPTGVNADTILERFGEPIAVTGTNVMDDEPSSLVGRLVDSASKHLLRRDQRRYVPPPRMFHSDQADVKIEDILPRKKDHLELYQGDMVYAKHLVETGRAGSSLQDTLQWSPWSLWPGGLVNWYSDPAAPVDQCALATFKTSASMLEKYTCLRFKENVVPTGSSNSIKLTSDGQTCWAYVGMSSQSQVNLGGPGCQIPGIALHEIGHAVGLIHQQSRANRDNYVTVMWDNIKEAAVDNFKKIISGSSYDTVVADKPYDYSSIMHYSSCEFSTSRYASPCGKTLDPSDKTATGTMGQREYLSKTDIDTINQMYGCTATCGDGIQNQGEQGVDCGGPCARVCNDPKSDGIVPLPSACMASSTTPFTQKEIYIMAAIGGLAILFIVYGVVAYFRNRRLKKDVAKQKLLAQTRMTPQQLKAAVKQRAAGPARVAVPTLTPSAPPQR